MSSRSGQHERQAPHRDESRNALDAADPAARIDARHRLTAAEALAVLQAPDEYTLGLVAAASTLRRKHFGNTVKANHMVNLKSGLCPEDCTYCPRSLGSKAEIPKCSWLKPDAAVHQAGPGGASRVCMVASARGPSDRDVDRVATMISRIKDEHLQVEVCACLGIPRAGQAERLAASGADAHNPNLNTAESLYPQICSTPGFAERVDTVRAANGAGLSPGSGLIMGMGETRAARRSRLRAV